MKSIKKNGKMTIWHQKCNGKLNVPNHHNRSQRYPCRNFFYSFSTSFNFSWQSMLLDYVNPCRKSFVQINKMELISILLSFQSKVESANNDILKEVRKLNQIFSQLEAGKKFVKQVTLEKLVDVERQCWVTSSILEESVFKWWVFLTVLRILN